MPRDVADYDPTNRFTNRVADYVRFRPRYPAAILETLRAETGLTPEHVIADVGSGTGFSAEMFLQNGNVVYGVEPNAAMRAAGATLLAGYPRFSSVDATAEATTLPGASVDYVTAGQALHWFNLDRARAEFARILRRPGWAACFWNTRRTYLSLFMAEYEAHLYAAARDYAKVSHVEVTAEHMSMLFAGGNFAYYTFPYAQTLTLEGLIGRTMSASYAPAPDDPRAAALAAALTDLFARYQHGGTIQYDYVTELYVGRVARE